MIARLTVAARSLVVYDAEDPIVTTEQCFDALQTPPDRPGRSPRDSPSSPALPLGRRRKRRRGGGQWCRGPGVGGGRPRGGGRSGVRGPRLFVDPQRLRKSGEMKTGGMAGGFVRPSAVIVGRPGAREEAGEAAAVRVERRRNERGRGADEGREAAGSNRSSQM